MVAPRAGAWIETYAAIRSGIARAESRPARARGLKQGRMINLDRATSRAPRGRVD